MTLLLGQKHSLAAKMATSFFNTVLLGTITIALVDKLADATKHSYPQFSRITSTLCTMADHGLRVTAGKLTVFSTSLIFPNSRAVLTYTT
jgi:hypothetical protein